MYILVLMFLYMCIINQALEYAIKHAVGGLNSG